MSLRLTAAAFGLAAFSLSAATNYVWQTNPRPASPYSTWATAAHTIQDAVDAASAGDMVLVTNGIYSSGGRAVGTDLLANRVAVDKPITLQSVNGPTNTIIQGYQLPGTTNGDGAIRCVYLTDGAVLSGFTLTNGATRGLDGEIREQCGGGLWCDSFGPRATNCILAGNSACCQGGGVSAGVLIDCTLTGNSAKTGGGASGTRLDNCTLAGNSANEGGGAYGATLLRCTLAGNLAHSYGGATSEGTLEDCRLTSNSAHDGGGTAWSELHNCTLTGNSASGSGGGAFSATLSNCTLTGNSASNGAGACYASLNNCTVTANAAGSGGGVHGGTLNNCIVYFNTATNGENYSDADTQTALLNNCCTTPMPTNGGGNITHDPAFVNPAAGDFHLRCGSPCIDAGTNLSAIITHDLDGHPRPLDGNGDGIAAFDLGAFEFVPPACYVWQDSPTPLPPFNTWASAAHTIQDAVDAAQPRGAVLVTNGVYAGGVAVTNPLALRSVNGPQFTVINGGGTTRCVWLGSNAVLSGFTLTNGYRAGRDHAALSARGGGAYCEPSAILTNCVLVNNTAYGVLRSDMFYFGTGRGGGAYDGILYNCTLTGNSANESGGGASQSTLHNCILTSNAVTQTANSAGRGGGAYESTLYNCILTGNWITGPYGIAYGGGACESTLYNCTVAANSTTGSGGGAFSGTLYNCTLTANWASYDGGGAYQSILNNCTLVDNMAADSGGGASYGSLNNCIVGYNAAWDGANYWEATLNYCCTAPLPTKGVGNITSEPVFADLAGGNLRLQSYSPCINAGNNPYATNTAIDLDGNPRVVSGTVDIGAYEDQGAGSVISYAWLQQYGLPTDGSADFTDPDHDGIDNWHEWLASTDPTNRASSVRLTIKPSAPPVEVTFFSSASNLYTLHCCTNLTPSSVWTPVPGQTDVPGSGAVLTLTATNPPAPAFYRVSVRFP